MTKAPFLFYTDKKTSVSCTSFIIDTTSTLGCIIFDVATSTKVELNIWHVSSFITIKKTHSPASFGIFMDTKH